MARVIPLKDRNPSRSTPYVTYALVAVNIAVFAIQLAASGQLVAPEDRIEFRYGVKPAFLLGWFRGEAVLVDLFGVDRLGRAVIVARQSFEPDLANTLLPYFTSMFLHGGWLHIGSNLLFLWIAQRQLHLCIDDN